jgi:predicted nucleic acid-binding Zn ribbon protein
MTPKNQYKELPEVLKTVLKKYNLSDTIVRENLIENWTQIIGDKLSDKCSPVTLVEGELTIKAKNKIWKEELALRQHDLVNLLNRQIGKSLVKKINIT